MEVLTVFTQAGQRSRLPLVLSACLLAGMVSCGSEKDRLIDLALTEAQDNRVEIEHVLTCYDGEKGAVAEYVVAAMPGLHSRFGAPMDSVEKLYRLLNDKNYWGFTLEQRHRGQAFCAMPLKVEEDLKVISSDYLTGNIDDAWRQWKSRKWNRDLPSELFCELILPYRIGDEKFTEWRESYRQWAGNLSDSLNSVSNSVDAALMVSDRFGRAPFNPRMKTPHRTALNLLEAPVGICREDCDRTVYAMRAHGVPVAIDEMLVSPDYGGNHQWNVVYDTDDRIFRMFDNRDFKPTRDSIHDDERRKGKVYRHMFAIQTDRMKTLKNKKNVPSYLADPRLKDVTAEYFGSNEAVVPVWGDSDEIYLALFCSGSLKPIDVGEIDGKKVRFHDIEPELIYFPASPDGKGGFVAAGYPFMLQSDGNIHSFIPDESKKHRVSLTRKMPLGFLQRGRMKMIEGCYIESSDHPDGPWHAIDTIKFPYIHSFNRVSLRDPMKEKYLRIMAPTGVKRVEIGEFIASRDSVATHRAELFALDSDGKRPNRKKLTDGDILVWYTYKPKPDDGGIVLEVKSDTEINYLFLLPHNDDNFVVPGEEYELEYFTRDGWKSLGRKTATGFSVEFEAPRNAVLWLRNLTKGKEEQIFICRDGRQLFSVDLRSTR